MTSRSELKQMDKQIFDRAVGATGLSRYWAKIMAIYARSAAGG
jgi:hypothetical protein